MSQFFKVIYIDFGIERINNKIKDWYKLSWDEFERELNNHQVKYSDCMMKDWREFFINHKRKVLKLMEKNG
ncbi:hypothetical protein RCC89_07860 [Cytophagaceae bacterium ABcell3]|nr:hypothetical protein RCC89_07860 [Cytophagaceae bacterium ABcell3]